MGWFTDRFEREEAFLDAAMPARRRRMLLLSMLLVIPLGVLAVGTGVNVVLAFAVERSYAAGDYQGAAGSVTFAPGQTTRTVSVSTTLCRAASRPAGSAGAGTSRPSTLDTALEVTTTTSPSSIHGAAAAIARARSSPGRRSGSP